MSLHDQAELFLYGVLGTKSCYVVPTGLVPMVSKPSASVHSTAKVDGTAGLSHHSGARMSF